MQILPVNEILFRAKRIRLSLSDLAADSGVSVWTLYRWEKGFQAKTGMQEMATRALLRREAELLEWLVSQPEHNRRRAA